MIYVNKLNSTRFRYLALTIVLCSDNITVPGAFAHFKFSLAVLFASSFAATGTAAFLQSFKKTLNETSGRVIEEGTQLVCGRKERQIIFMNLVLI